MTREEEKQLEIQMKEIKRQLADNELVKKLEYIQSHRKYVGTCYKRTGWRDDEDIRYIKILSEVSESEYHMECFEFTLPLSFRYNEHLCKSCDRYPDAVIECEPFEFVSRGIFCYTSDFKEWIEITQEEFDTARDECYKQMIELTNKQDLSNEVLTK